ncbi:MAG: ATPase [Ethanoligenens sp.]|uniref:ATPase n=1 Tax=Ethanoligenens sp. TaxID=2099655 RepID=UPI0039EBDE8F
MSVDELLDALDEMIDRSWGLPLFGGRCMVDAERVREIIDDIRLNLPAEVRQARAIVADRSEIVKNARAEAAAIVRTAQDKANALIREDEITKGAREKANEIVTQANQQSKEVKVAAADFVDKLMHSCEEVLTGSLTEVRQARQALRKTGRKG